MRTNIEIDDDLMAAAMAAGGFKTKKEAVEEGLRLVRRRQVYNGLLALRGKLQWDDSDAAWAQAKTPEHWPENTQEAAAMAVQEPLGAHVSKVKPAAKSRPTPKAKKREEAARSKAK